MATKRRRHRWPFQLTHLLRGATQHAPMANGTLLISTHAPLARCDRRIPGNGRGGIHFNSRTSCEVRPAVSQFTNNPVGFQLTHLLRGATPAPVCAPCPEHHDFNSRTSCEVRHCGPPTSELRRNFNSRTSCEVRLIVTIPQTIAGIFQLTHLLRGATSQQIKDLQAQQISTHAPLARCDKRGSFSPWQSSFISTHAPLARCDAGPDRRVRDYLISTHAPLARCDCFMQHYSGYFWISTHAPLARCDMLCRRQNLEHCISTHAPLARCDECKTSTSLPVSISTHAPLARCDAAASGNFFPPPRFQLTHLLRGATEMKNVVLEIQNFNSRTSCEVRQLIIFAAPRTFSISTHAPLARCDQISTT